MKRPLLFFYLLPLLLPGAASAAPQSAVRTQLASQGDIWAGQQVVLVVELIAPGTFTGAPFFDLPQLPGVLIMPPTGSPTLGSETRDGVAYTLQRHELAVLSPRAGEITVPPFEVRFAIKPDPLAAAESPQSVMTAAIRFTAQAPPGVAPDEAILTSRDLRVTEQWQPAPTATAKPGQAFIRTLEWSAADLPSIAFPPLSALAAEIHGGLGSYPAAPELTDRQERGTLHASRRERVTYVCKAGGPAEIPGLQVRWWDPERRQLQHLDFPTHALMIEAAAAPPPPTSTSSSWPRHWFAAHLAAVASGSAAAALLALALRFTRAHWLPALALLKPRHLAPLNPPWIPPDTP